jgi:hypothetical protein
MKCAIFGGMSSTIAIEERGCQREPWPYDMVWSTKQFSVTEFVWWALAPREF